MSLSLKSIAQVIANIQNKFSGVKKATRADLSQIRHSMTESIIDCEVKTVRRVRAQLDNATSAEQLWLMRSEVFQAVAEKYGQHEAGQRVKSLNAVFTGFISEKQIRKG